MFAADPVRECMHRCIAASGQSSQSSQSSVCTFTGGDGVGGTEEYMETMIPSASCTASSEYPGGGYACERAFDTNPDSDWATNAEGVGSWIQSNFGTAYRIIRFEYRHRAADEDNRDITLSFSDGTSQTFTLEEGDGIQSFAIVPVQSSFVNLTVDSEWRTQQGVWAHLSVGLSICGSLLKKMPLTASCYMLTNFGPLCCPQPARALSAIHRHGIRRGSLRRKLRFSARRWDSVWLVWWLGGRLQD